MLTGTLHTWVKRHIAVRQRLERVCTSYLLFLMVATTKHSLKEAARFSGLHPSLFAKLLHAHAQVASTTLEQLSKTQARQFAKALPRVHGLPGKIAILIDATLQHRASLHPDNTHTFNHGKGYVIGHQWTNVVLVLGDMLIPLKPIPFYRLPLRIGEIFYASVTGSAVERGHTSQEPSVALPGLCCTSSQRDIAIECGLGDA